MLLLQMYHELVPDAWIKQPWNTYSSLFFFVPVAYWLLRLRGEYKRYAEITAILPLLFLNGIGSTLFHARNGGLIVGLLDVLPPFLMMLYLTAYFWKLTIGSWRWGAMIVGGFIAINFGIMSWLQKPGGLDYSVNVYYFINGVMVMVPVLYNLWMMKWHGTRWVMMALSLIALALVFRSLDVPTPNPWPDLLPQGTHFLWHLVSALSVFPLGVYLMEVKKFREKQR